MSNNYKTITNALKGILAAEMTVEEVAGDLDEDMNSPVTAVKIGQYVPGSSVEKPILFLRPDVPGLVTDIAGNIKRRERMLYLLTGAVSATSQESAINEIQCLFNNVQNVLCYNATSAYWGSGKFGWGYGDDDNPEQFGKFHIEAGESICIASFAIRWSCEYIITRD